jgi:hypothetical protein
MQRTIIIIGDGGEYRDIIDVIYNHLSRDYK